MYASKKTVFLMVLCMVGSVESSQSCNSGLKHQLSQILSPGQEGFITPTLKDSISKDKQNWGDQQAQVVSDDPDAKLKEFLINKDITLEAKLLLLARGMVGGLRHTQRHEELLHCHDKAIRKQAGAINHHEELLQRHDEAMHNYAEMINHYEELSHRYEETIHKQTGAINHNAHIVNAHEIELNTFKSVINGHKETLNHHTAIINQHIKSEVKALLPMERKS